MAEIIINNKLYEVFLAPYSPIHIYRSLLLTVGFQSISGMFIICTFENGRHLYLSPCLEIFLSKGIVEFRCTHRHLSCSFSMLNNSGRLSAL